MENIELISRANQVKNNFKEGDKVLVTKDKSQSSEKLDGKICTIKTLHEAHVVLEEENHPNGVWISELSRP